MSILLNRNRKISIKSNEEIMALKKAGRVVGKLLYEIAEIIKPGISTYELEKFAEMFFEKEKAIPAFKNYKPNFSAKPFPAILCTSINDEVVHGIPSKKRILQEGDILKIDVGSIVDGWCGDSARTYPVGNISSDAKLLVEVTEKSLYAGIDQAVVGGHVSDIGAAVQRFVEAFGFSPVRELSGHGIGRNVHEEPCVPNFGNYGQGPKLLEGMTICIEPMINAGSYEVTLAKDGWTVTTKDKSLSAHFEHMVAITKDGPVILSSWGGDETG
ncbi:methionine aminopeptidase, type I [Thermodesulfobium narugense DSM 14796]|uniref:Methionine aminopeptidase n=1 Tax=Thermodesulfobium narugense DSM 14796 TaxID=747365 RepID=M1E7V9_9BACT|nr:type I methionyl aminopeptidase [Thermodesulfobium narugense]AEE14164.1 methionine aminopeptidase, type I [Thermodesulfobium narugense DSM 14796]